MGEERAPPAAKAQGMSSRWTVLATAFAAAVLFAPSPAGALPPSAPVSALTAFPAGTLELTALAGARDGDGRIEHIELCLREAETSSCVEESWDAEPGPGGVVAAAARCVDGDERTLEHVFDVPAPGVYPLETVAVGGRCLDIGEPETASARILAAVPPAAEPIPCAAVTDPAGPGVGVSEDEVTIGAVVSMSGRYPIGGRTLAGLRGALDAVNATGGVCGRQLVLRVVDDGGRPDVGADLVESLQAQVLAFAAVSAEPLRESITRGTLAAPVAGVPGTTSGERKSPLVWPIAVEAPSWARVVVGDAAARGAETLALLWDAETGAGSELRDAVLAEAASAGLTVAFSRGIRHVDDFERHVADYASACGPACDAVVLALDELQAGLWLNAASRRVPPGAVATAAAERLTSRWVASVCGTWCGPLTWWTSMEPPTAFAGAGAARYAADAFGGDGVRGTDWEAEAGWAAGMLMAYAVGGAGPAPTRDGLATALDAGAFDLGLAPHALTWPSPGRLGARDLRPYRLDDGLLAPAGDWIDVTD